MTGCVANTAAWALLAAFLAQPDPPNDPFFDRQAALFGKLEVLEAWARTKGSADVTIGIIDNGFDFFHPDLRDQLQPGFYAPDGYHPETYENIAHGTCVASIMVARENNGIGMAGLAPGCRALTASLGLIEHTLLRLRKEFEKKNPQADMAAFQQEMMKHMEELKAFGERWTRYQALSTARSIRYLVGEGVKVINISGLLSLEMIASEEARTELQAAFAYAAERDVVVVVGAGNNAREVEDYPGDRATRLVVGATLLNDQRWEEEKEIQGRTIKMGSNWGRELAVMAPAENMVVCQPHEARFYKSDDGPMGATEVPFEDAYTVEAMGATSMATPIVTSLVALVRSLRPDLDARSVVEIIRQGCDDIGESGYDVHTGHGRVNFGKTMALAEEWGKPQ